MLGRRVLLCFSLVALVAWCGWVSGFHTDTAAALATWCVSVFLVVVVNTLLWRAARSSGSPAPLHPAPPWPRPGRGGAASALWGLSPWLMLLATAIAWDVLGIDTGPHVNHLTISALAQAFRSINAGLLLLWILVGVGYGAARARAPHRASRRHSSGSSLACLSLIPPEGSHEEPALLLPSSRPVGIAFWVAVALVALVTDQVARRSEGRIATAGELVRFATTTVLGNAMAIVVWLLAGYHLFAR